MFSIYYIAILSDMVFGDRFIPRWILLGRLFLMNRCTMYMHKLNSFNANHDHVNDGGRCH